MDAALVLLAKLGVSPEDLVAGCGGEAPPVPTFVEFVPQVAAATSAGTLKAYGTYWNRAVQQWELRRLTEPGPLEIEQFGKRLRACRVIHRNGRGGSGAEENYIAAMRCLHRRAVADGLLTEAENPAAKVVKPRRQANTRRAIPDTRLAEINDVAATTGNDPAWAACCCGCTPRPRAGAAVRWGSGAGTWTRSSAWSCCGRRSALSGGSRCRRRLTAALLAHWDERGDGNPASTGQLLRYYNRRPISYRRYDHLWLRIGEHLPWVATQGITAHWLRHTIITWVERTFGYAVARAFAGHSESGGDVGSTATYIKADLSEIAAAVAALAGEPHPLAAIDVRQRRSRCTR